MVRPNPCRFSRCVPCGLREVAQHFIRDMVFFVHLVLQYVGEIQATVGGLWYVGVTLKEIYRSGAYVAPIQPHAVLRRYKRGVYDYRTETAEVSCYNILTCPLHSHVFKQKFCRGSGLAQYAVKFKEQSGARVVEIQLLARHAETLTG